MAKSVVYEAKGGKKGPATHALIIGVGSYPHLVDGNGKLFEDHQGLGQLTSPPVSARAIAEWMIDKFENPERPLKTVRLLISEKKPKPFKGKPVQRATLDAIDAAVTDWFSQGNENAENMLAFYFCGHGLGTGLLASLLAEDFGKDPHNPLANAIDFHRFRLGMNQCAAKHQAFFVDACRSAADVLMWGEGFAGQPLKTQRAGTIKKQQPVFYSTLSGAQAFGEDKKPSYFTQALLAGLAGAGADRTQGDWRVSTGALQNALAAYMLRKQHPQLPPADDLTPFFLHWVKEPKVPVIVKLQPEKAVGSVQLSVKPATGKLLTPKKVEPTWELELAAGGPYVFEAVAKKPYKPVTKTEFITPPELNVPMKVAK